jgi:cation diffusion facilitator family transporter
MQDMHSTEVSARHNQKRLTPPERASEGRRVTLLGALANLFLIGFKFSAGLLGNSYALIADAVHSVSDLFTDAVVLFGLRLGTKAPDKDHPFGHGRFETLASSIVGLVLFGAAVYIGFQAVSSIHDHSETRPTWLALSAAAISILLKEGIYRYTMHVGRRIRSAALVANAWHHRSDALSSVAVFVGVGGTLIRPDWHMLDAYAALIVAFLIFKVSLQIIWTSLREFTDTAPKADILNDIRLCAKEVEGVIDIHDLKVRTSGGRFQMELHVVVDGNLTVFHGHKIAKEVEHCLAEQIDDFGQIIVHVDPCRQERLRQNELG